MTYSMKVRPRVAPRSMSDWSDDLDALINGSSADDADPTDNVNQTASGGTTTSASDFVSVAGVCKPQNFPALASVQALQRQLNRVAQIKNLSKVAVDGSIGPATVALFAKVQSSTSSGTIMGDASSCMGIAPDVDVLGPQVQAYADSLGAPAVVSGPVALAIPTIVTKSGKTVVAPNSGIVASLAGLSTIEKLALVGVLGGIGYMLWVKPKPSRATTKARR